MNLYKKRYCFSIPNYTGVTGVVNIKVPIELNTPVTKLPCKTQNDVTIGDKLPVVNVPGIEPSDPCSLPVPQINTTVPSLSDYVTSVIGIDTVKDDSGVLTFINDFENSNSILISEPNTQSLSSKMRLEVSNTQLTNIRKKDGFILYDDLKQSSNLRNSSIRIYPSITTKVDYFTYFKKSLLNLWLLFNKFNLSNFQNIINLRRDFDESDKVTIDKSAEKRVTFSDILSSDLIQNKLEKLQIVTSLSTSEVENFRIRLFSGSSIQLPSTTEQKSTYVAISVTDITSSIIQSYVKTVVDNVIMQNLLSTDDCYVTLDGYVATGYTMDYTTSLETRYADTSTVITGSSISEIIKKISLSTSVPIEMIKYKHYDYKYLPTDQLLVSDNQDPMNLYSLTQLIISRNVKQRFWIVLKITPKEGKNRTITTRDIVNNYTLLFTNIYNRMITVRIIPFTDSSIRLCEG